MVAIEGSAILDIGGADLTVFVPPGGETFSYKVEVYAPDYDKAGPGTAPRSNWVTVGTSPGGTQSFDLAGVRVAAADAGCEWKATGESWRQLERRWNRRGFQGHPLGSRLAPEVLQRPSRKVTKFTKCEVGVVGRVRVGGKSRGILPVFLARWRLSRGGRGDCVDRQPDPWIHMKTQEMKRCF